MDMPMGPTITTIMGLSIDLRFRTSANETSAAVFSTIGETQWPCFRKPCPRHATGTQLRLSA